MPINKKINFWSISLTFMTPEFLFLKRTHYFTLVFLCLFFFFFIHLWFFSKFYHKKYCLLSVIHFSSFRMFQENNGYWITYLLFIRNKLTYLSFISQPWVDFAKQIIDHCSESNYQRIKYYIVLLVGFFMKDSLSFIWFLMNNDTQRLLSFVWSMIKKKINWIDW